MESIVYANSPLAEYLEGLSKKSFPRFNDVVGDWSRKDSAYRSRVRVCIAGNGENEADWEVEPQLTELSDEYQPFAPPLSPVKVRTGARGLNPLSMGEAGWARRAKFYELFSVSSFQSMYLPGLS